MCCTTLDGSKQQNKGKKSTRHQVKMQLVTTQVLYEAHKKETHKQQERHAQQIMLMTTEQITRERKQNECMAQTIQNQAALLAQKREHNLYQLLA